MAIVEVRKISKAYGTQPALEEISFAVEKGELFGFIGPDGAGKTTLFRILTTLLQPDRGSATVLGLDLEKSYRQLRPRLGYMPGRFSLYPDLGVRENIDFFASVFGTTLAENYELVKPIYRQLEPFEARLAGDLSGGMKQKLALCCALIHQPELLVLDEPTTGVDAVSRQEFWDMLHGLKQREITIIVSTPYMDEANRCDRVALIEGGTIMKIDTPGRIASGFEKPLLAVRADRRYELLKALRSYEHADSVEPFGADMHYTDRREGARTEELRGYLQREGFTGVEVREIEPGIEDRFMALMQQ